MTVAPFGHRESHRVRIGAPGGQAVRPEEPIRALLGPLRAPRISQSTNWSPRRAGRKARRADSGPFWPLSGTANLTEYELEPPEGRP